MNMLGLLPKITDEDWNYIKLWIAADFGSLSRHELPLMNREDIKKAGETWCNWCKDLAPNDPDKPTGSFKVMKKLFG